MTNRMITSERIDDVPLLVYWLLKMHIDKIIDAVVGPPHGNWQGLSYGQLAVVFIAYILTECNHFLSPVREWVLARRESLSHALIQPIRDTDFTDDRLEALLDAVGADEVGEQIDLQLGQHLIRAYALPTDTGRIDTTSVSVYHRPKGSSRLSFGHSKDRRPDLRQFKVVLGTLDPVGIPLCSAMVSGQCADNPLYLPAWRRMVEIVGHADFLAVGDCKMADLETRAQIHREGGSYLTPLPLTGNAPDDLQRWVLTPPVTPVDIYLPKAAQDASPVGQGFEVSVSRRGNPKRATSRPTAERLLKAFDGITLYRLSEGDTTWHEITPLSALQRRILGSVGVPESVYIRLGEPLLATYFPPPLRRG